MKILLVDDSALLRQSLKKLLGALEGGEVVGEATGVMEAITLIKSLKPDVVILDLRLADGSGFEILERIKRFREKPLVLILTQYTSEQIRKKSQKAGVDYFFNKSTEFKKILDVLKSHFLEGPTSLRRSG